MGTTNIKSNVLAAVLTIVALTTWHQAGWAQNTVESIRQRYNDMKKYVASHTNDNKDDGADFGEFYHLQARQWLPATGGHIEDTYLYYDEVESEDDVIYAPHYVKFVTTKYNYAAREYYQEFLYDPDGNVAFIYAYDPMTKFGDEEDDMQYEFRFYLNKGKLLNAIVKNKRYDESVFKQVWTGSTLKSLYQSSFDEFLGTANTMKELFVNIEKEAYTLATESEPQEKPLKRVYDENANPLQQIDQALLKANTNGKFVICQVGGNWCPWCLRFADFITNDTEISQLINENFEYIHVNYNPRRSADPSKAEQAAALMKRLNNCGRFGFPVFVVLDTKGNVLHIQDSSFLEQDKGYNREKVLRFFNSWTPKAVK